VDDDTVARIGGWLREAAKVTVLTGAGISTDSGIPDFRGPRGVWTRDPSAEALSTLDTYVNDAGVRKRSWRARADHPAWAARPNAAHLALVELERSGRLRAIVTQNIDELHQRAGLARRPGDRGARHDVPRDLHRLWRDRAHGARARTRGRR
jgi:NAD-dependent deacetylase